VYGSQATNGPLRHNPLPSQINRPAIPDPEQVPGPQTVPTTYLRHAPLPSQVPSRLQLDAAPMGHSLARRGVAPVGTTSQVPSEPGRLHDMHVPVHAELQQTPSTQNPLPHSAAQEQGCPRFVWPPPLLVQASGRSAPSGVSCPASTEVTGWSAPASLGSGGDFRSPPPQPIASTAPAQNPTNMAPLPRMTVTPAG
jgi:hypothetical protein